MPMTKERTLFMKKMSVLELPLDVQPWQAERLNKRYKIAAMVYNAFRDYEWNKIICMRETKQWREELSDSILRDLYDELKNAKEKESASEEKRINKQIKDIYDRRGKLYKDNGITRFSFLEDIKRFCSPYSTIIPSNMAQLTIAAPLYTAVERCLYGNGDFPRYKRIINSNILKTNGKSGIRLMNDDRGYFLLVSNRRHGAKPMTLPVKVSDSNYNMDMINRDIKIVAIVRKRINGKYKYYTQLTVEGAPFQKVNKDGEYIHQIGNGKVGLNIYKNKVSVASDSGVFEFDLTPDMDAYQSELNELTRCQEAIRRRLNPQNYNDNGTVKKGIYNPETRKTERLHWNSSIKYDEISNKRRELQRVYIERRTIHVNNMIHKILAYGDQIIVPDYCFNKDKRKNTKGDEVPINELKKRKDRRIEIQQGAPASFLARLNKVLEQYDREPVSRIRLSEDNFFYCHMSDVDNKDFFKRDHIELPNGTRCSQGLYKAFVLLHYNSDTGEFNHDSICEDFNKFLNMVEAYQSKSTQ